MLCTLYLVSYGQVVDSLALPLPADTAVEIDRTKAKAPKKVKAPQMGGLYGKVKIHNLVT